MDLNLIVFKLAKKKIHLDFLSYSSKVDKCINMYTQKYNFSGGHTGMNTLNSWKYKEFLWMQKANIKKKMK